MAERNRASIGQQLVTVGILNEDQIREALEVQKKTHEKLGTILVSLGYCTEEDIARALATKTGFEFISLNNLGIDMEAANLITPESAMKYRAIPVAMNEGTLYVAMENPNDVMAIDDLHILTGMSIKPIVVSDNEIESALNNLLNLSRGVESGDSADGEDGEDVYGSPDSSEPPAVQLVNQILNTALRTGASDVHIESQERLLRIRYRIDGVLHEMMNQPMRMHAALASRIKVMGGMDISEKRLPQDGRATIKVEDKVVDVRVATIPAIYGETITLRLLPRENKVFTIHELGFPRHASDKYNRLIHLPYGFVLVTGPTGSGKSTTLYSILTQINTPEKNIITLEDPMERRIAGINQIQMNDKAGMTFASGLRSVLRNDPDIIMIGEIRDAETAKIAVESALTGHLVFSTLHTNDSSSTVVRLGEMGVEPFLVSSSLAGVIAQRLARILCPRCKQQYTLSRTELKASVPDFPLNDDEDMVTLYRPSGCIHCNNTGYKGRIGIFELLQVTESIRKLILQGASADAIQQAAIREGMKTMREDGLMKVKQGLTSIEEALRVIL
jgi:type IV pilus assembly protein PilB